MTIVRGSADLNNTILQCFPCCVFHFYIGLKDCHFIHFLSLLKCHLLKNISNTPMMLCYLQGLSPAQMKFIVIVSIVITIVVVGLLSPSRQCCAVVSTLFCIKNCTYIADCNEDWCCANGSLCNHHWTTLPEQHKLRSAVPFCQDCLTVRWNNSRIGGWPALPTHRPDLCQCTTSGAVLCLVAWWWGCHEAQTGLVHTAPRATHGNPLAVHHSSAGAHHQNLKDHAMACPCLWQGEQNWQGEQDWQGEWD